MNLTKILHQINVSNLDQNPDIQGVTDDSRDVKSGYLFIAVQGYKHDGHQYIDEAIKNGAVAIIGQKPYQIPVPYIQVADSQKVLGQIVSFFYNEPSKEKWVIGVTGTNGKTTTSYMLKAIFEENGYSCGLIGTIEYYINGQSLPSKNTTPGAVELQKLLYESNDEVVIIEISSHALRQNRVAGLHLDAAIFTNLDSEHLDYHHNMNDYFETKYKIFQLLKLQGFSVINTDDEWGKLAYDRLLKQGKRVFSVGTGSHNDLQVSTDTQRIYQKGDFSNYNLNLKLPGFHNRFNAALSLLTGNQFGLDRIQSINALNQIKKIKGRFEIVDFPGNIKVVVDYAHTPKGFYHCLNTIRECGAKRITQVFGFRGGRDPSKRKSMMKQVLDLSDYYILTLDDLNESTPSEMEAILNDFHQFDYNKGEVIIDRTLAIKRAIEQASSGEWVVITGKGHEQYAQAFSLNTKSDLETVDALLKNYVSDSKEVERISVD